MRDIILILISLVFEVSAQVEVERIAYGTHQGDSAYVYPITLSADYNYKEGVSIPPFHLDLPSGKYVLYQQYLHSAYYDKVIIADFQIINNKVTGMFNHGYQFSAEVRDGVYHGHMVLNENNWKTTCNYSNGLKDGLEVTYYPKSNDIYSTIKHIKGEAIAPYRVYYRDGTLKITSDGIKEIEYSSGISKEIIELTKGTVLFKKIIDKKNQTVYESRLRSLKYPLEESIKLKGEFKMYYPNGNLFSTGSNCEKGLKIEQVLYPNGNSAFKYARHEEDTSIHVLRIFQEDKSPISIGYYIDRYYSDDETLYSYLIFEKVYKHFPDVYHVTRRQEYFNYFDHSNSQFHKIAMDSCVGCELEKPTWYYYPRYKRMLGPLKSNSKHKTIDLKGDIANPVVEDTLHSIKIHMKRYSGLYAHLFEPSFSSSGWVTNDYLMDVFRNNSVFVEQDGIPFSGEFEVVPTRWIRRSGKMKRRKNKILFYDFQQAWPGWEDYNWNNRTAIVMNFKNGKLDGDFELKSKYQICQAKYQNGLISEYLIMDRATKLPLEKWAFKNGDLHGEQKTWDIETVRDIKLNGCEFGCASKRNPKNRREVHYLKELKTYDNGERSGVCKEWGINAYIHKYKDSLLQVKEKIIQLPFQSSDTLKSIGLEHYSIYKKGQLDGSLYRLYGGDVSQKKDFKEGKQDGLSLYFNHRMDTLSMVNWSKGKKEGEFFQRNEENEKLSSGFYKGDVMCKDWGFYSEKKGGLIMKYAIDSNSNSNIDEFEMNTQETPYAEDMDFHQVSGSVKYYYPNGNEICFGNLLNGERIGEWRFYSIENQLMEIIHYRNDSAQKSLGSFWTFNSSGDTIQIGEIKSSERYYNCETDIHLLKHDKAYQLFINATGDTLVKNGNGYIQEYNELKVKTAEGNVRASLKEGEWKEYTTEGNLCKVGEYVQGEKHRKWLEGDLTAIPYTNENCFSSSKDETEHGEKVEITVIEYEYGAVKSSNTLYAYKKKEPLCK